MSAIARFATGDADFESRLGRLLAFDATQDAAVDASVASILGDVKARGDLAVLDYTRRFDRIDAQSMADSSMFVNW